MFDNFINNSLKVVGVSAERALIATKNTAYGFLAGATYTITQPGVLGTIIKTEVINDCIKRFSSGVIGKDNKCGWSASELTDYVMPVMVYNVVGEPITRSMVGTDRKDSSSNEKIMRSLISLGLSGMITQRLCGAIDPNYTLGVTSTLYYATVLPCFAELCVYMVKNSIFSDEEAPKVVADAPIQVGPDAPSEGVAEVSVAADPVRA